jgi:soluble lytic murein transglycosylase-like protein
LAFRFGSRRTLAPTLAVLALAGAACFGGARSEVAGPIPSPQRADRSAAALDAAHDSVPTRTGQGSPAFKEAAAPKPSAPRAKPAAAKPAAPKAQPGTAPAPKTPLKRAAPPAKVDSTALEFAVTARLAHEPLTRAIARRTRNPVLAERAAWAVTREAGRLRMSPSLLAAVLLVENRQLDSAAVSSQGAIGLMQVMPIHAGSYGCESADLMNVDANICHGARILHLYLVRSRSVTVALKRYNGCVRGANTPRCYRYPVRVLATASRLRRDILTAVEPGDRRVRM